MTIAAIIEALVGRTVRKVVARPGNVLNIECEDGSWVSFTVDPNGSAACMEVNEGSVEE